MKPPRTDPGMPIGIALGTTPSKMWPLPPSLRGLNEPLKVRLPTPDSGGRPLERRTESRT